MKLRALRQRARRAPLLVLVYAASLTLVAVTCASLALVVADHVTRTAIASSVAADSSFVSGFVRSFITPDDLRLAGPNAARTAEIQGRLSGLIASGGMLRVKVYAPDGTILFSDVATLRGQNFGFEEDLKDAFAGTPFADLTQGDQGEERGTDALPAEHVLEEYLPVRTSEGIPVVFEIYRDAGPIVASADASRRDTVLIAVAAAAILAILLYLIFRAAQGRLSRQTRALVEAERRDALTGLLNHGSIVLELVRLIEESRVAGGAVGVAIVDVDNFRAINEAHGHAAGDQVLSQVAQTLRSELSQQSILGRYGPDEYLVVAPPSCADDLEAAVGRLRSSLLDLSLQFGVSERLPVTVSAGICFAPVDGDAATELLSVATVTLGEAKASGGDAVRLAAGPGDGLNANEQTSFDVLQGLVIAVDTKDRYTKRHSEDVARYALFIADRVGLEADLRRTLGMAGLMHDVGKIGIPDAILRKPAALTADEYAIVKQHVALGDMIVRDLPNIDLVRSGVRHHHERWDGTGYLDGLAGEDIPLFARILAVADAFSAMTTSRPYRKALDVEEAIRRLEDAAGSQLDPTFVVAFVEGLRTARDAPLPGLDRPTPLLWVPRAHVA
ncbi:MAG: diguanylate cyclase [Chloroflexi bacterium]|nr:MAG: diguanylate cyclase [Chloroflexota bacterium]